MRRAIDETERRRAKQIAHNEQHGITPKTIVKNIADIMADAQHTPGKRPGRKAAEQPAEYKTDALSPAQAAREIARLEKEMFKAAEELEFEKAANIRDQISRIREKGLQLPDSALAK